MPFESSAEQPEEIQDPRAMRALAHPVRVALLDHLLHAGPATATQCAAVVGESPSACSYHLRTLAKYGFVEEAPDGHGRERPWRARHRRLRFSSGPEQPLEQQAAASLLRERYLERDEQILRQYLVNEHAEPPEWQAQATLSRSTMYLTADEAQELTDQLLALIRSYERADPAERPAGARPVHVVLRTIPRQ
ncbi:MAG: helix-turn-helix domain-containing protein, partial [Dehalococcoidia bacterium]